MMQKLSMLLTTRGESIDTIKLVSTQTELEVEVQKLKETVHRTEEQLAAAKQEVRHMPNLVIYCPAVFVEGK